MIFGTICSGIGAPELAWSGLGWRCAFMSEIDAFPRAVLAHHYPKVPLHGDFTTIRAGDYAGIDLLCGGTPCQSFSIAGMRGGMADARGNLALEYLRLAERLRPRWLVWENVPGVRSSGAGRDFGAFLGGLGELGYGWAYRSLDAQYAGLAQRRERVFVVGYLGDWRRAAAVLFEPASLRGDTAPSREAGKGVAAPIAAGSPGGSGYRLDPDTSENLIAGDLRNGTLDAIGHTLQAAGLGSERGGNPNAMPHVLAYGSNNTAEPIEIATACQAHGGPHGRQDFATETFITHALRASGFDASEDGTGRGTPLVPVMSFSAKDSNPNWSDDIAPTLRSMSHNGSHANGGGQVAVAFTQKQRDELRTMDAAGALASEPGMNQQTYAMAGMAVRRLSPRECERLQGFPDDYTLIPYRKGLAADGPRYKALGNSMAVPVVRWIGRRIEAVEASALRSAAA